MQLSDQATNRERLTRNLMVVGSIPTWGSVVYKFEGSYKNKI